MKMFKKISAIVLVVAMMLTMVSVTAFAAGPQLYAAAAFDFVITDASGDVVTSAEAGTRVNVAVYTTAQSYDAFTFKVECGGEVVANEITATTTDKTITGNIVNLNWSSAFTVTEGVPIATIPMMIPEDASGTITLITPLDIVYSIFNDFVFGESVTNNVEKVTIEVPSGKTDIAKNEIATDETGKKTWELEWTKPSQEAVAIIAYYDGTTMLNAKLIKIADRINKETGTCTFTNEELKCDGATMVRCYLFDKLNGLHPVTNVVEERDL